MRPSASAQPISTEVTDLVIDQPMKRERSLLLLAIDLADDAPVLHHQQRIGVGALQELLRPVALPLPGVGEVQRLVVCAAAPRPGRCAAPCAW